MARLHFGAAKLYLINLCVILKLSLEGSCVWWLADVLVWEHDSPWQTAPKSWDVPWAGNRFLGAAGTRGCSLLPLTAESARSRAVGIAHIIFR